MDAKELKSNFFNFLNSQFDSLKEHSLEFNKNQSQKSKTYLDEYRFVRVKQIQKIHETDIKLITKNPAINSLRQIDFHQPESKINMKSHWIEAVIFTWFLFNTNKSNFIKENWKQNIEQNENKEFFLALNLMRQIQILECDNATLKIQFHINPNNNVDPYIKLFPYSSQIKFDETFHLQILHLKYTNISGWFVEELFKTYEQIESQLKLEMNFHKVLSIFSHLLKFIIHQTIPLLEIVQSINQNFLIEEDNFDFKIRTIIFKCSNVYYNPNQFTNSSLFLQSQDNGDNKQLIKLENTPKKLEFMTYPNRFYKEISFDNFKSFDSMKQLEIFEQQNRFTNLKKLKKQFKSEVTLIENKEESPSKFHDIFSTLKNNIKTLELLLKELNKFNDDLEKSNFEIILKNNFLTDRASIFALNFSNTIQECKIVKINSNLIQHFTNFKQNLMNLYFVRYEKEYIEIKVSIKSDIGYIEQELTSEKNINEEKMKDLHIQDTLFSNFEFQKDSNEVYKYIVYTIIQFFEEDSFNRIIEFNNSFKLGNYSFHKNTDFINKFNTLSDKLINVIDFLNILREYNDDFYNFYSNQIKKNYFKLKSKGYVFGENLKILLELNEISKSDVSGENVNKVSRLNEDSNSPSFNLINILKRLYKTFIYILISDQFSQNSSKLKAKIEYLVITLKFFIMNI